MKLLLTHFTGRCLPPTSEYITCSLVKQTDTTHDAATATDTMLLLLLLLNRCSSRAPAVATATTWTRPSHVDAANSAGFCLRGSTRS